ncbi:hypothetical protein GYMLUDRAFT_693946 [Collybiopsis luxurians FD-317 M1]|uniref:Unplaced genomic scaffold GYMLUscaffold_36, whole genome shotgun sequence n=1 Tax=Collybiopsis luxurians FD-317 M1 TaxID=944289 RepID=A0A0D0CSI6_9AGAR|nr:hypothetical protein GYMLUDRAFT_693946 [Collybiopsis luxurians FD-317 M1]
MSVTTKAPNFLHTRPYYRFGKHLVILSRTHIAHTTVLNYYSAFRAILNGPATYGEDVDQFRPERFLNSDGTTNSAIPYPTAAFGYGRRICAGKSVAQSALWLTVASLLACFDLSKAVNADGKEIHPSTDYVDGLIMHPPPFECTIRPRSKVVEKADKAEESARSVVVNIVLLQF